MNKRPSLVSSSISKAFVSGRITQQVIKDSSVEIFPGQLTLVVGPSGSGKSTLLSMLSGLLRPDSGHVSALGIDLWSLAEKEIDLFRLQHCGFVFQGFNLFGSLTACENVTLPLQYLGLGGAVAEKRALRALAEVGLETRSHLRPMELSGGEKQRVAVARALVKKPQLLFADEPTSALDKMNGKMVTDLLEHIATEYGATVLVVTHDSRLMAYADRILTLEDGVICSDEHPKHFVGGAREVDNVV